MSSLSNDFFFLPDPVIRVNIFNINKNPVYLKTGIIEFKAIEDGLAKDCHYLAPRVLGIISETKRTKTVIIEETIPTNNSSVSSRLKNM